MKLILVNCSRAIAASAPVAQFSAPCNAFGRIVTADYTAQSKDCSKVIRKSWDAINNITKDGRPILNVYVGSRVLFA